MWSVSFYIAALQTHPCEEILTGKNLFSLQGTLFSLQGWVCSEIRGVLNSSSLKLGGQVVIRRTAASQQHLLFCPSTIYTPVDVCTWNIMKSYWFDLMISAAPIILSFLCSQLSHLKIDFDLDLEKRLKSLWIPHIFIEMTFKTRWLKRCRY